MTEETAIKLADALNRFSAILERTPQLPYGGGFNQRLMDLQYLNQWRPQQPAQGLWS